MTVDISTQIRDYAAAVDEMQEPMALDEIIRVRFSSEQVRPVGAAARPAGSRPFRPWLVAATAALGVLVLVGGAAWLTQTTGSDTPVADTVVPTTLAATDIAAQKEGTAVSVTGNLLDSHYWEAPLRGPVGDGRMVMSDERISGDVTFTANGEVLKSLDAGDGDQYLYWGTMVIENNGGTWEGTHFAADHLAQSGVHAPIVMQLVGHGDYEGFSAILYRTVISDAPGHDSSVDGMIFPGNLPPDRTD
jgi:hypothetical protein